MRISVVICTHNRAKLLRKAVLNLMEQAMPPEDYEVIVVDNASTDDTKGVVRDLMKEFPNIRYIYEPNLGLPNARNRGIREARGEVVAFLDDDCLVQPGWMRSLLRHYANPKVGGVGGMGLAPGKEPGREGTVGGISHLGTPIGSFNILTPGPVEVEHLRGYNMSFRREILLRLGGFDPRYNGSNLREDTDMCVRVRRAGYKLIYDPNTLVIHLYAPKGACGRDDRASKPYRFSVAKNTAYFRLKHFLSPLTLLSLLILGPMRVFCDALRGRHSLSLSWIDLRGRWAGVRTYLIGLREERYG